VTDPNEKRYQVFVSSTFRDLQEERQKVLQALLEMRAFPTGMEMFPSADDDQWDFIQREILSSDYYVVIIAGRYGSLAADGTSFTEKEYDFAVASHKPVMAFLFHDLGQIKGVHLDQEPGARAKLDAFRAKAAKGKLVKEYRNPDELKSQVWHALTHAFNLQPQEGWVRAKNQRRIEDLEEITELQKKAMELEAEVARLRKDTGLMLSQGDDLTAWSVDWTQPDRSIVNSTVTVSWKRILLALFRDGSHFVSFGQITTTITRICKEYLPEGVDVTTAAITNESMGEMVRAIVIQLRGLGYITVENTPGYGTIWSLTPAGSLQIALLVGQRRE
jgi:hypothetical protein